MAKNVFKAGELSLSNQAVLILPPKLNEEEKIEIVDEDIPAVATYTGPSVDEIREEVEKFKAEWESEKIRMVEDSNLQAKEILENANSEATEILNRARENANFGVDDAKKEAQSVLAEAEENAKKILADAESKKDKILGEAKDSGYNAGRDEGFKSGKEEADRLISKLHEILGGVAKKRAEIIADSETLIIDLILNTVKKVVRSITENQKEVIIETVLKALAKLKVKADVVLRVNFDDVNLATENMKEFLKRVEKVKSIKVIEDSTVDRGGCIVETDYGTIDARIASQLREIENKIRDIMPIV